MTLSLPMTITTPLIITLTLLLTLPLLFLFSPHYFFPPKHHPLQLSLSDELEDLSLFRRATLSSSTPSSPSTHSLFRLASPSRTKPKIAFLFLTTTSLPFSPLWETFFTSSQSSLSLYNIYVHTSPSAPPLPGLFATRAIPSKPTERSSPTLISAERRLLSHALLDDPLNQFFALLSPSCIPLHSLSYIHSFLSSPPHPHRVSFIEVLANETTLPSRYNARGGHSQMLPEIPFSEFRVGSQFFVLNKKHAITVIKDLKLWRKFKLPCVDVDSCYPEEHYFPTLLSMEDPKGCSNYTLTNVDWTDSVDGHPRTYSPEEVSADLIRQLRRPGNSSHEYLFARKFSPDCVQPLMDIAQDVIFKD